MSLQKRETEGTLRSQKVQETEFSIIFGSTKFCQALPDGPFASDSGKLEA